MYPFKYIEKEVDDIKKLLLLFGLSIFLVACTNGENSSESSELFEVMTIDSIDKSLDNDELTQAERSLIATHKKFGDLAHVEYDDAVSAFTFIVEDEELIEFYEDHKETKNNYDWFDFENSIKEYSKSYLNEGIRFVVWDSNKEEILLHVMNGSEVR